LAGGKKKQKGGGGYPEHHQGSSGRGMGDVLQFGQQIAQTGLLGRKAQMGAAAAHVASTDTSSKSGGLLGTAAASGLMGHKGRMAAHAMGMGREKGHGGMTTSNVLGSGLMGNKGVVAGAAMNFFKGK